MRKKVEVDLEEFKRLCGETMTMKQIREQLGISERVCTRVLKELGIHKEKRQLPPKRNPNYKEVGKTYGYLTITDFVYKESCKTWYAAFECKCGRTGVDTLRKVKKEIRVTCGLNGCPYFHSVRQANGRKAGFTGHEQIFGTRWSGMKIGAAKRGYAFDISIEYAWELYLAQDRRCALSGVEIGFGETSKDRYSASLDRINSTEGYIEGNVQWVHKVVNIMKKDMSDDEFAQWCRLVAEHNDKNGNVQQAHFACE